ncbi:MAG: L-lactate dehydrogenase, partial [Candidatus Omnitrophota bacterium]
HAGDYPDLAGSDLVVITAGRKQKPGQTRIDLVKDNVEVYRQIIPQVMKYAPGAIFLIVSNPVDVLSYAAYKFSGKPAHEVIGSGTVLDSARFRYLLSKHCHIDPHNIHAYILGEHGDTEFPVWSSAMIGGVLFKDYCHLCKNRHLSCDGAELKSIFTDVRDSAYQIIERKQETSYGIGLAMVRITRAIIDDENAILPVSSLVSDYLGQKDLYLSLPAVVNKNGVREVLTMQLSSEEEEAFRRSARTIREILTAAGL